jgi:glutamate synthase (NADPH/NADH) small chain
MDVARTALRHGVENVTIFSHNNRLSAAELEIGYARVDGCEFEYDMEVKEITEEGPLFRRKLRDGEGKLIGYGQELELVKVDSVLICVSQGPKNKIILTTPGLRGNEKGLLITEDGMTSVEGLFAAGDVVSGAKSIVAAVAQAKQVAERMDAYMMRNEKKD